MIPIDYCYMNECFPPNNNPYLRVNFEEKLVLVVMMNDHHYLQNFEFDENIQVIGYRNFDD